MPMIDNEVKLRDMLANYFKIRNLKFNHDLLKKQMENYYPEWVIKKWLRLHESFDYNEFVVEDAEKVLKMIGVRSFLSLLKEYNLLIIEKSKKDARKSIYKLNKGDENGICNKH